MHSSLLAQAAAARRARRAAPRAPDPAPARARRCGTRARSRSSAAGTRPASAPARAVRSAGRRETAATADERDERDQPDQVLRREHLAEGDERARARGGVAQQLGRLRVRAAPRRPVPRARLRVARLLWRSRRGAPLAGIPRRDGHRGRRGVPRRDLRRRGARGDRAAALVSMAASPVRRSRSRCRARPALCAWALRRWARIGHRARADRDRAHHVDARGGAPHRRRRGDLAAERRRAVVDGELGRVEAARGSRSPRSTGRGAGRRPHPAAPGSAASSAARSSRSRRRR